MSKQQNDRVVNRFPAATSHHTDSHTSISKQNWSQVATLFETHQPLFRLENFNWDTSLKETENLIYFLINVSEIKQTREGILLKLKQSQSFCQ